MTLTKSYQNRIHKLKEEFDALKKGKGSLLRIINEVELPEAVYNSNAIENSTLTISETEQILLEMEISRSIELREIFEAKNLAVITEYIEKNKNRLNINVDTILLLHKMLISNINDDIAGRFRNEKEYVRVGRYLAPAPTEINEMIAKIIVGFKNEKKDILSRIIEFHLFFEKVHPFVDGNGRIGRLLINLMLLKNGFPQIIIKNSEKQYYYDALKLHDKGEGRRAMKSLAKIIFLQLSESLHKRVAYLSGKKIITVVKFAEKKEESKHSLLNKAKRQTIPAFRERGVWKIGE